MMMRVSIFRVSNSRAHVGCIAEDMSYISSSFLLVNTIYGSLLAVDLMDRICPPVIVHEDYKPLVGSIGHVSQRAA
jgi:hypothetical protein